MLPYKVIFATYRLAELTGKEVAIHLAKYVVLLNLANEYWADGSEITSILEWQRHALLEEEVVATRRGVETAKGLERLSREDGDEDLACEEAICKAVLPRETLRQALLVPPNANAPVTDGTASVWQQQRPSYIPILSSVKSKEDIASA